MGKHKSDIDYGIIGARVKELRKAKGLTQERLGELSGIEPSNISHIERGAAKLSSAYSDIHSKRLGSNA